MHIHTELGDSLTLLNTQLVAQQEEKRGLQAELDESQLNTRNLEAQLLESQTKLSKLGTVSFLSISYAYTAAERPCSRSVSVCIGV